MNEATNVAQFPAQSQPSNQIGQNLTLDVGSMNAMMSLANVMATGKATVPQEYRNSPGDCLAVVMQAVQWGMNPFAVAQKTHFISGKIGYEAQLVNAVITSLAPTKDRLHFEWFGDWTKVIGKFEVKKNSEGKEYRVPAWSFKDEEGLGVKVWATLKGEDEPRVLELLLAQARTRNSTLWADDPRQQIAYLGTKRWARLYCSDVIMGVYTPDELDDIKPEREINPAPQSSGSRALDAMRNQSPADRNVVETVIANAVETVPEQTTEPVTGPGIDPNSVEFDKHATAIENADSIQAWQTAYGDAWNWATSTGNENIQKSIKQLAGEAKQKFATKQ